MKLKKVKHFNIILLAITIVLCLLYNFVSLNQAKKYSKVSQYPMQGYGIELKNSDGSNCDNFSLKCRNNEFNYRVKFVNNTDKASKFILSAYIDYNQVSFYSENNALITNYEFSLGNQSEKDIPIKFNVNNYNKGTHVLNFIVYTNVGKGMSYIKENPDVYQITSRHNLVLGDNKDIKKTELSFCDTTYKSNKTMFQLNIDKDLPIKDDTINQSLQIKAKPDQIVKIPVNVGSFEGTDEYVFWATLDYKQVSIDENSNYWYFKLPEKYATSRSIEIKAPHDRGTYRLNGFLAPNPWNKIGESEKFSDVQSSNIVELVVN